MSFFSFEDFWKSLCGHEGLIDSCRAVHCNKGGDIFRQGETRSEVFVMTQGLVKLHYVTLEGKERIKSFIMDRGLFGSRMSQSLGRPSSFSATCLEDSVVYPLPYKVFESACVSDPDLSAMAFQFFQWLGLRKELREYELLCLSAEERYMRFLDGNPALCRRITQIDMAHYLGITPIALSRIKGRLSGSSSEGH